MPDLQIDFLLLVELTSALRELEDKHGKDYSCGEAAKLLAVLYPGYLGSPPRTLGSFYDLWEAAYVNTWGRDHECDQLGADAIQTFVFSLGESLLARGVAPIELARELSASASGNTCRPSEEEVERILADLGLGGARNG